MARLHDLACVVHLHSTHSDGTGTVAQIAEAAASSGVDVVLLTDHDSLEALRRGEEGRHGEVLVLVGEEVSQPGQNHYLAFGIEQEIEHGGLSPREICAAVAAEGGFGFAAHPFSRGSERFRRLGEGMPWHDLDCEGLDGVELWSFVTDTAESLRGFLDAARFVARPERFVDHPPERNLAEWDRLCARRRVTAIGGLDAHQFGLRVGGRVPLRLMSYRRSFRHLRTHVLCDEALSGDLRHDRARVYDALRAGRCYIAMDSVAPAHGFGFWAEADGRRVEMGEEEAFGDGGEEPAAGAWTLRAELPASARLRLVKDGRELWTGVGPRTQRAVSEPGVYRLEAYRESRGRERTWILSNPVYLR